MFQIYLTVTELKATELEEEFSVACWCEVGKITGEGFLLFLAAPARESQFLLEIKVKSRTEQSVHLFPTQNCRIKVKYSLT